jgi:glycosyl transferase family 87
VERGRPPLRLVESAPRPASIAPALEFAALGAGLTLVALLLGRLPSWFRNLGTFQSLFALAFAFYALALLRIRRYERLPHAGLAVLAVAVAARLALLPAAPSLSGDLYRYVWEGRVIVHGGNPYRESPDDPRLAPLRDRAIHPNVNHRDLATIYPPLAEAGFALVAWISPTVAAFKLWVLLHDLALVGVLLAWTRRLGLGPVPALAYAWNPLVLVEYAGSGHNDPTALVWLVVALALARERPVLSALALAAGALTKLAPLVALPFLMREWPWRARLTAVALLVPGLAWFVAEARSPASGLHAFWSAWSNNEFLFHFMERAIGYGAARGVALALIAALMAWALVRLPAAADATRLSLRGALLLSPVLHPWYLGWALAFEPLAPSAPWLLLSLTAVLNYGVLSTPAAGRNFHLPLAWRCVEYGAPLVLAIVLALRARGTARLRPGG